MRAVGIPCNLVLDLTLTDRPGQSQEDRAMIGHFQEPLDGSVEREDHEIVAARTQVICLSEASCAASAVRPAAVSAVSGS